MKRHLFTTLSLATLLLTSCYTEGYKIVDGKVYYHERTFSFGPKDYLLEGADAATFSDMRDCYAHDAHHAWYRDQQLPGVNGSEFRYLKHGYAKDNRIVFLNGKLVVGADAATFRIHSDYYTEDDHDFYWQGHPLFVSDKASFQLLGKDSGYETDWGRDRYHVYFLASKPDSIGTPPHRMRIADYDSFSKVPQQPENKDRVLSGFYARDKYYVYYRDTIVPGADPETFIEIDWEVGKDKNGKYKGNEKLRN